MMIFLSIIVSIFALILTRLMFKYGGWDQIEEKKNENNNNNINNNNDDNKLIKGISILYGTTTNTSEKFSKNLENKLINEINNNNKNENIPIRCMNIKDYDYDTLENENTVIFIISTWTDGVPPSSCNVFFNWLDDLTKDFRVSKNIFKNINFMIFGLGNKDFDENFCKAAITLEKSMSKLGARRLEKTFKGDDSVDMERQFNNWSNKLINKIKKINNHIDIDNKNENKKRNKKKKKKQEDDIILTAEDLYNDQLILEDEINNENNNEKKENDKEEKKNDSDEYSDEYEMIDMEDLGDLLHEQKKNNDNNNIKINNNNEKPEMVTPYQRRTLTKEGYKIIGSHSAVKLCRWTKNQLRGRGGCYKHTCYGITSYQCMEATPSLACANKCTFCWRHHKNPVGREWRWRTDPPEMIVKEAIQKHCQMIKEWSGVPGVKPDRLEEAYHVKHCALSLVGEPIMYPEINTLIKELHDRSISTFLVTNAQFPDFIQSLDPVTQLYVSIDAATKETLKAIDRPLFKDYWERFLNSLRSLKIKGQRTVYRLTLVKDENMEDIDDYVSLFSLGEPDLIEIKAVTYCGKSDASNLTIKNVPWHEEVRLFAEAVVEKSNGMYGIACEHKHSCLVLLAKQRFNINGVWNTWINYERFHELMQEYYKNGTTFSTDDYLAPTPSWAIYNSEEAGFDPEDIRWYRKNRKDIKYEPSESGCG